MTCHAMDGNRIKAIFEILISKFSTAARKKLQSPKINARMGFGANLDKTSVPRKSPSSWCIILENGNKTLLSLYFLGL